MHPSNTPIIAVTVLLFSCATCCSDIIEITDATSPGGANNITLDTATGFEWLDWSASTNISINQIETMFGAGGAFEGWRHATRNEIQVLFANMSLDVSNWPAQTANNDGGTSAQDAIDLLGLTRSFPNKFDSAIAFTADEFSFAPGSFFLAGVSASANGQSITASNSALANDTANDQFGHVLVRVTTVPEPSMTVLLLGGIAITLRRQRMFGGLDLNVG